MLSKFNYKRGKIGVVLNEMDFPFSAPSIHFHFLASAFLEDKHQSFW